MYDHCSYSLCFFYYLFWIQVPEGSKEEADGPDQEAAQGGNAFPASLRYNFAD